MRGVSRFRQSHRQLTKGARHVNAALRAQYSQTLMGLESLMILRAELEQYQSLGNDAI
jgi:hypothetical protein